MKKGKMVTNPQTGIKIEMPGTKMGSLKVVTTMGDTPETEISFCTYEGKDIDVNNLMDYYIMEE